MKMCEECVLGKSKKLPFAAGKHSSTAPLEYAHSDLWGPSQAESKGGGRYFISIIDDYSRKVWVYVIREKSQAFTKFKEWIIQMEKSKGTTLKCLRTDNGMEFLSAEFAEFCRARGIKRHRTAPNNPQQNGVAERMNRTLLERVRCMLISSGLSKSFWGEAVCTAALLINRCPSAVIANQTPDQRWYNNLDGYSRLKVFGCAAYAHIRQGKLEPRVSRCILLGYQEGVKAYRLWCIDKDKERIMISRDVVFDESVMPFLKSEINRKSEKETQDILVRRMNHDSDTESSEELEDVSDYAAPDHQNQNTDATESTNQHRL